MKKALITGLSGQDGFFLAELLLKKGYQVTGFSRSKHRFENSLASRLQGLVPMLYGDISNSDEVSDAVEQTLPDEIYNLASQSRPGESWSQPSKTLIVNGLGATNLFEAVRHICPTARICHASSSEIFGQATSSPQHENTPFNPVNPYAASKLYAHQMAKIYRDNHQLFISNAILFNHESEDRPLYFVTQKIAYGAACAALGILNSPDKNEKGTPIVLDGKLALGNFDVTRDWGYAPDYVCAMWLMLQQDKPDDFVIGTGKLHSLRQLCDVAYQYVGKTAEEHVISDLTLFRPLETSQMVADSTKAQQILGWSPSVSFHDMIKKMVKAQINRLSELLDVESIKG